ncbi:MAG TPA: PAS domain-containing protein [Geminicoccaceae bacterium]|nr:PAS domain-containing protein [Geminicoccus sp.]HMU51253.1 PAS domain-containing protein [Geminicoccaceae bacterium]
MPTDISLAPRLSAGPIRDALADVLLDRLALVVTDPQLPDNPIVHASPGFTTLTGYAEGEALGRNCRFLQGAGTDVAAVERLRGAVANGRAVTVDLVNYRKNGEPFVNRLRIEPIPVDGRPPYLLGVQDELPLPGSVVEDGRDMLLRDLRHRVNGAMQLVMSLLRIRMTRAQDPAVVEALGDALEQLEAVMLVQRRLDGLGREAIIDAGPALEELAQSLVAPLDGKVSVEFRCGSMPLTVARLEPFLLLANEAISNALRHGFGADRGGRILVSLVPGDGDGFELSIEDDGMGAQAGSLDRGGLGTMLMRSFARQLGGSLELAGGNGVRVCLRVPASSGSPSPGPSGTRA